MSQAAKHDGRLHRMHRNLKLAAQLVALHGDEFLWLFERFEAEVERLQRAQSVRQRAIELAKER